MHKTELPLDARGLIRQTGLKCTSARIQVLQLLLAQQEVLSADEVFEKLHQDGAKLNFSTVYRILESFTEKKLTEKVLHEARVFITPGFIFGSNGARYIRISLCCKDAKLAEALERIKKL